MRVSRDRKGALSGCDAVSVSVGRRATSIRDWLLVHPRRMPEGCDQLLLRH